MSDDLISAREVAVLLGVSQRTVLRHREEWGLSLVRLGPRIVRYRRSEVLRLVEDRSFQLS